MPILTIDLQEGFTRDHVVIEVDGHEVFNKQEIKSRMQIGLADSTQVEVGSGAHMLRVSLPAMRMSQETRIDTPKITHAGINRDGQMLQIKLSSNAFGYL
jgi:hypothetical protein